MKIYLYNFNVGSGIAKTGNNIKEILFSLTNDVYEYRDQNPPAILINDLIEQNPNAIIINEFYQRIIEAVYYYKKFNPEVRVILINHCSPSLAEYPFRSDKCANEFGHDGCITRQRFLDESVNQIINLNGWHTVQKPESLKAKILDHYHPISNAYTYIKPWLDREKDFIFYGYVRKHKFCPAFLEKLSCTNIHIDMYGPPQDDKYFKEVTSSPNIIHRGYVDEEHLPVLLNEYRFLIIPHEGSEPFNLTIAEAARCGIIPLVLNDRTKTDSGWIDWAKGCYVEYSTTEDLLYSMEYVSKIRTLPTFAIPMDKEAYLSSQLMIERTSMNSFCELLKELLN